ncbi:MAG TPA: TonB-dependent receptor plug domain-containing protein, partial [Candidatus Omnitrophota bacterium]|nr:TonB-dependent receptor plug domain-containing protein [Candidatus Omnitrophota bacterium]
MSHHKKNRSEQLRQSLAVLTILLFVGHLGWSWPLAKSRSMDEKNLPTVDTTAPSQDEVEIPSRPVAAEVTVLEVTRTDDSVADVTRSVSIISQEDIQNSTARSVPELLKSRAGIVISKVFDNPKGTSVDIRGFGETSRQNVLVLVDGRRANQIDFTGADWSAIPLSIVEQVEVIRGPSTVLYGDNATGGVINIVTKKAGAGVHAKAETEVGLHKYKRNGGTVSVANDWARGLFHFENTQDGG